MSGAVPPLPLTLSWCAQEQRFACVFTDLLLISVVYLTFLNYSLWKLLKLCIGQEHTYLSYRSSCQRHLCSPSRCGTLQAVLEGLG